MPYYTSLSAHIYDCVRRRTLRDGVVADYRTKNNKIIEMNAINVKNMIIINKMWLTVIMIY